MKAENILEVRDMQTTFKLYEGLLKAVNHVDLTVRTGKTLGIIGESGCGKSVTAHSILNTVQAPGKVEGGSVMYRTREGKEVDLAAEAPNSKFMRSIRGREISMIFQEPMTSMSPVYTIGQQMTEACLTHQPKVNRAVKKEAEERAIEMLKRVGMQNPEQRMNAYPHQLSGGMCQRAMIAMALMLNPRILIADEPTTALDVTIEAQILHLMRQLKQEFDTSILMITHNLGIVSELCDVVNVMYLGEIVEHAATEALFEAPMHPYTQGLIRSVPEIKESDEPLENIPGMVPDLKHVPTGCRFCERCRYATERCRREKPELTEAAPGHQVRCFRCEAAKKEA